MDMSLIILFTSIIILAILIMVYITLYYKMLYSKIRVDEAEEVVKKEIQARLDLINNCKKTITKQTKKELTIFNDLEKIVKSNISTYELEEKVTEGVNMVYIIKNDYPKLEEKKEFKEIVRKLGESDSRIEAAKIFYNTNNDKLKSTMKKFPAKIIALIHKFRVKPSYSTNMTLFNEIDDGIKI